MKLFFFIALTPELPETGQDSNLRPIKPYEVCFIYDTVFYCIQRAITNKK